MPKFNVAFCVFRDVICDTYPERRAELDTYLAIISDLAMTYGRTLFYEYHKSFSAKSAMYIQRLNQRLDWLAVDLALISRHFTGHRALSCSLSGAFTHTPSLCPRSTKFTISADHTPKAKDEEQLLRRQASKVRMSPENARSLQKEKVKPTPVNIQEPNKALKKHPNRCFVHYLTHSRFSGRSTLRSYLSAASLYMRSSIAKSTLKVYDSAWFRFTSFSATFSAPVLIVNIAIVSSYIMHCLQTQKMQPSSIKSQVSGIQFQLRCLDPSVCSLLGHPSIRLLLNGIKKGTLKGKEKQLALTLPIVKNGY
ncbi:hypothetical protein Q7C36_006432 [Tachysurus vachellii]|uniref:Uncharacterized protein n=1 Tax=Tachysurus vachellii TaxID=175792 RepID=A0AA88NA99_TACVA|nr:hypothetical protein Q7C36_006432 [Tachysurus vachellii]